VATYILAAICTVWLEPNRYIVFGFLLIAASVLAKIFMSAEEKEKRPCGVPRAVLFLWARLWAQGKEGQLVAVGKRIAGRGAGRLGRRIGRER